jgi:hypothetical protein
VQDAYAVERVSTKDDALTINRALRAEIEERWAWRSITGSCQGLQRKDEVMSGRKRPH